MTATDLQFQTGGTLVPNKHFYVDRREQDELFTKCVAGEYCYILAARQLGKSSMAKQVVEKLKREKPILPISTDLSAISKNPTEGMGSFADFWYKNFLWHILDRSQLMIGRDRTNTRLHYLSWWKEKTEFDNLQRMILFFREIILGHSALQVVVFVDEIDRFPRGLMDDFLMALRYLHNERAEVPEFQRLSFVLIGQRLPRNLTVDKSISPFNIGSRIDLDDLDINKSEILTSGIELSGTLTHRQLLERIFAWTNGHPYLTHATCKKIFELTTDETTSFYLSTQEQVDSIINGLAKSEFADIHLNKIIDWIHSLPNQIDVIRLYGFILEGNTVLFDETIQPLDDLRYSGLIKVVNGLAKIRNQVYAQAFNKDWVIYQLKQNGAIAPSDFLFGLDRLGIQALPGSPEKDRQSVSDMGNATFVIKPEKPRETLVVGTPITEKFHPKHTSINEEQPSAEINEETSDKKINEHEEPSPMLKGFIKFIQANKRALIITLVSIAIISWGLYRLPQAGSIPLDSNPREGISAQLLIGGSLLIILFLIIGIVTSRRYERTLVEERLGQILEEDEPEKEELQEASPIVTEWLNQRVASNTLGDRIARELARADLKLKVGEYYALVFLFTVGCFGLSGIIGNWNSAIMLIGVFVSLLTPRVIIKQRQARRLRLLDNQLVDALEYMANSLVAGYSTMQAFEAIGRQFPSPIGDEFRRVVQEIQLGIPTESALDNLLRRVPSANLDFLTKAIGIQREVGGNLQEIISTYANRLRTQSRAYLQSGQRSLPSFTFFYIATCIIVTVQSALIPMDLDIFNRTNKYWGTLWFLILMWSLIFLLMGYVRFAKIKTLYEFLPIIHVEENSVMTLLSLLLAYFFGVPFPLLIWLLLVLIAFTPLGYAVDLILWHISAIYLLVMSLPVITSILKRIQLHRDQGLDQMFEILFGNRSNANDFFQQLNSIAPWLFVVLALMVVALVLVAVFIVLIRALVTGTKNMFLFFRKSRGNSPLTKDPQDEDDPLQARLSEFLQRGDISSLEEIELSQPFIERAIFPLLRRFGELISRFTPQMQIAKTEMELKLAGNPWPIDAPTFIALRILLPSLAGCGLVAISTNWFITNAAPYLLLVIVGFIFLLYHHPQLNLKARIRNRQYEIREALPDALELISICNNAGLGFEAGMSKVATRLDNELAHAFSGTIRKIQLGMVRREALKDMSDSIGLPEITRFVNVFIQSEQLGVSQAKILRIEIDTLLFERTERYLKQLSRLDLIPRILLVILFGPILMFWFALPILAQFSNIP